MLHVTEIQRRSIISTLEHHDPFSQNSLKPFTKAADITNIVLGRDSKWMAKIAVSLPAQLGRKQSPEEARETLVQKHTEKLKPDMFDRLVPNRKVK